jgi:hypothetical protein
MLDGRPVHGRPSSSHLVVTKSTSWRALSAPVGRPEPAAGRHTVAAVATSISSRSASGWASSHREGPRHSISSAPERRRRATGNTAQAPGQSQHFDLVTTSGAVLRNQKFQHYWHAVGESGLGHECLAGVWEEAPHRDRPLGLELGDHPRKVPQPPAGSAGGRSVGHRVRKAQVHLPRTPDLGESRPWSIRLPCIPVPDFACLPSWC